MDKQNTIRYFGPALGSDWHDVVYVQINTATNEFFYITREGVRHENPANTLEYCLSAVEHGAWIELDGPLEIK